MSKSMRPSASNRGKKTGNDPAINTKAMNLVYVNCDSEGYRRIKKGKGFVYLFKNRIIKDKKQLERIRSLVIPPAWRNVWICRLTNGHLQATGFDKKNRKQYRYHPVWNELRNQTKFYKLLELGKVLPRIRKQVTKDLSLPGMPKDKVLAVVVSLMEKTGIRTGNDYYEKTNGSFGVTTLKDKHVKINGARIKFVFCGKKGVEQQLTLHSKKLSGIVRHCRDIPGKELFQYFDEEGKRQCVDSGMVNDYIRQIAGSEFTAKDFRTWCGSVIALKSFEGVGNFKTSQQSKKNIVTVLDEVSSRLGNTRAVCKKYYVHPALPELYEKGKLEKWLTNKQTGNGKVIGGLLTEEKAFMRILRSIKK
jgi:DNA topoisomerase-1